MTRRVVLIFLDGVGIGPSDAEVNPFVAGAERIPTLLSLLGGRLPTIDDPHVHGIRASAFPLDAQLDTDGTPQSGTGQAALLTGHDTGRIYGRHFGPWTPVNLRPLVEEESVLMRAKEAGHSIAFANAYPKGWPGPRGSRRIAGPPLAARGAGALTRHEEELGRGEAVSSEIVNDGWQRHLGHTWLPNVTPEEAGGNLARIAAASDLTLYAHYSTDTVGHRGTLADAVDAIERVDHFLAGYLEAEPEGTLTLVASDHGNIEDTRGGHTTNPVLGTAIGDGHELARGMTDIRQVTGFILEELSA